MASTINATTASGGGVITTADASGVLDLQTADVTRASVSSSGLKISRVDASNEGGQLDLCRSTDNASAWAVDVYGSTSTPSLRFVDNVASATRMQIDSSGNLLVGTTSSTPTNTSVNLLAGIVAAGGYRTHNGITGSTWTNAFNLYWTGSATQLWIDSTNQGTITVSSDYRIKKNIETQELPALTRISQIRPVTYTFKDYEPFSWKADGIAREGFIAHELAEVIPSAVEGEKDAKNQVQSLKLDALCSVMVKAIQELKAIIDTQAERIAVLENK